jgi:putative ABC transport system permease protein
MPMAQNPLSTGSTIVVQVSQDPMSMAAAVEQAIHQVDKDQPITDVQPLTQYMADSIASRKFSTLLLAIFSGLTLLLAAIGIYGVMSYTVSLRIPELGVRMALGAQRGDVFRLVVGHGLALAVIGVAAGLAGSFIVTRFMATLLFGVTPTDPATFACVALLLAVVALVASYIPARRAMRVDPVVALRHE